MAYENHNSLFYSAVFGELRTKRTRVSVCVRHIEIIKVQDDSIRDDYDNILLSLYTRKVLLEFFVTTLFI